MFLETHAAGHATQHDDHYEHFATTKTEGNQVSFKCKTEVRTQPQRPCTGNFGVIQIICELRRKALDIRKELHFFGQPGSVYRARKASSTQSTLMTQSTHSTRSPEDIIQRHGTRLEPTGTRSPRARKRHTRSQCVDGHTRAHTHIHTRSRTRAEFLAFPCMRTLQQHRRAGSVALQ